MIKKIKTLIMTLATAVALLVPAAVVLTPATTYAASCNGTTADIKTNLECGTCLSTDSNTCATASDPTTKVNSTISLVINILSIVVGVVAVIMIIFGGLKYILSAGNDSSVASAKNTILYAIIGLVIVALAQFIVRFVLAKVS